MGTEEYFHRPLLLLGYLLKRHSIAHQNRPTFGTASESFKNFLEEDTPSDIYSPNDFDV